jgi:hypothetical protein
LLGNLRRKYLPFLIPVILIGLSFWRAGVVQRYSESRLLQKRSAAAQEKLTELQAVSVAANLDVQRYEGLVEDFSQLTGLNRGRENARSKGEINSQISRLIDAVVTDLRRYENSPTGERYLIYKGVTPGDRQVIEPFIAVSFEMNLEGRFFAVPLFLDSLSRIAKEQKCAISVGELNVSKLEQDSNTGVLRITIPLRAYFLEE